MNRSLLILILPFAIYYSAYVSAEDDNLNDVAFNLLSKITDSLLKIDSIKRSVNEQSEMVNVLKNSIIFGIQGNPKMIQLETYLEKHRNNRNHKVCSQLKERNLENLNNELKDMLAYLVNNHLEQIHQQVNEISERFYSIAEHLQGDKLLEEIINCEQNRLNCKLTNEYAFQVHMGQTYVKDVYNVPSTIIEEVLQKEVLEVLPDKVTYQIYEPVLRCMKHS